MQRSHALDHIRALAAFLVFCWHFLHWTRGYPVPFDGAPTFPLAALIDEGHVGVAVFMCLSGYLFAQLLDGKQIDYPRFMLARFVRLAPLLCAVMVVYAAYYVYIGRGWSSFAAMLVGGLILPVWVGGAWSIATEMHFYLVLPLLLAGRRKSVWAIPVLLGAAILLRAGVYWHQGDVKVLSYFTIFGRIDQFALGIVAYDRRNYLRRNHALAIIATIALGSAYLAFDNAGGWWGLDNSPIWIFWPTFEGAALSVLIGWYASSWRPRGRLSDRIAQAGYYSYGIYLLHIFPVFFVPRMIDLYVMDISNFYIALAFALPCFAAMVPVAALAHRFIERPFQRFKPGYVRHQLTLRPTSIQPHATQARGRRGSVLLAHDCHALGHTTTR